MDIQSVATGTETEARFLVQGQDTEWTEATFQTTGEGEEGFELVNPKNIYATSGVLLSVRAQLRCHGGESIGVSVVFFPFYVWIWQVATENYAGSICRVRLLATTF